MIYKNKILTKNDFKIIFYLDISIKINIIIKNLIKNTNLKIK